MSAKIYRDNNSYFDFEVNEESIISEKNLDPIDVTDN